MEAGTAHPVWLHPGVGGSRFYKTSGWASHKDFSSKQHLPVASASALCLSPCADFLCWWTVMWKHKPHKRLPSQVVSGHGVCLSSGKETSTHTYVFLVRIPKICFQQFLRIPNIVTNYSHCHILFFLHFYMYFVCEHLKVRGQSVEWVLACLGI